mgnify:FL=1
MIISFNGDHGSGKSTIAERIAKELQYERFYLGQIFRDLAKERDLTLIEYLKLGETDASIDRSADDYIVKLGKERKDFVIESRTAWHFLPNSLKIYLGVSKEEGAKRMFKHLREDNHRSNEDKGIETIEDVIVSNEKRKAADDARYQKYYSIDANEMKNYDFILDTTDLTKDEVFEKILEFIRSSISK